MYVTPIYAAILALLFIALSVRTLVVRRRLGIGIGNAGNEQMLRAVRAHGNFAEYAPIALLLACMLEVMGAHQVLVHFACASLVLGRVSHAFGVSRSPENYRYRVFGMAMTFTSLLTAALTIIGFALFPSLAS